jgi:hypothetical protein
MATVNSAVWRVSESFRSLALGYLGVRGPIFLARRYYGPALREFVYDYSVATRFQYQLVDYAPILWLMRWKNALCI